LEKEELTKVYKRLRIDQSKTKTMELLSFEIHRTLGKKYEKDNNIQFLYSNQIWMCLEELENIDEGMQLRLEPNCESKSFQLLKRAGEYYILRLAIPFLCGYFFKC